MVVKWVVAEVHQAWDLNCHFDVKSNHFGPGYEYDDDDNDNDNNDDDSGDGYAQNEPIAILSVGLWSWHQCWMMIIQIIDFFFCLLILTLKSSSQPFRPGYGASWTPLHNIMTMMTFGKTYDGP